MLRLDVNGYTRQQVIDQLHGRSGSRGLVKFRYDLLNYTGVKIGELDVSSARCQWTASRDQTTASFLIKK